MLIEWSKLDYRKHSLKQSVLLQAGSVIFLSGFMSRKSKLKTGRILKYTQGKPTKNCLKVVHIKLPFRYRSQSNT